MSTITASPGLVYLATNSCTPIFSAMAQLDYSSSFFSTTYISAYSSTAGVAQATVLFKNSGGTTLVSSDMSKFTRTMAANGYAVFSNMLAATPSNNGTIAYIQIQPQAVNHYASPSPAVYQGPYLMTFTVGAIGSGADIEIDNRDVTTSQPWRLDGSIRFRVPSSFTYSL